MKWLIIVATFVIALAGSLALYSWIEAPGAEPPPDWKTPVLGPPVGTYALELFGQVSGPSIRVGEPLPVRFWLKNAGKTKVTVLQAYDSVRYPIGILEVVDQDGTPQKWVPALRRCGNVNPLRSDEFHDLRPGERVELYHGMIHGWRPSQPGTYTVTFTYDNRGKFMGAWQPFGLCSSEPYDAPEANEMLSKLRTVPQDVLVSKPLRVIVQAR